LLIAGQRPQNAREIFNLRHAGARNVIEWIFGVVKQRFQLMVAAPEYSLAVQGKIIRAICVLHNFIRVHNPDEDLGVTDAELSRRTPRRSAADFGGSVSAEERTIANVRRDEIAQRMWEQYQEYIADM
jgi:DDE superfamily endonuclease